MLRRLLMVSAAPVAAFVLLSLGAVPLAAQSAGQSAAQPYDPPKTPWGDPDLQGQWPAASSIPMQRPEELGEKAYYTDEEFAERERATEERAEESVNRGLTINPPGYWTEVGNAHKQTSLVISPSNGRIPALTPSGRDFVQSLRGGLGPGGHFPDKVDSPEDFDIYSRCITRGLVSSMLPTLYNFGNQIVQAPGYVVIRNEMIHEARVVPITDRPHVGDRIEMYMGDARGHWEGNTLVVETTNFTNKTGAGGGYFTDDAVLVERFTRLGPDELRYEVTINDPNTWTEPWTIRMPFDRDPDYTIYEYACHEGNYMMTEALTAARQREAAGKETRVDRGAAGGPPPRTGN